MDFSRLSAYRPHLLSVLRIVTALLFIAHGTAKYFGFPSMGGGGGGVQVFSLFGVAGLIELVAGVLILVGLWTRPAAFIASGEMAVAYWMMHAPNSPFPMSNGGEAAVMFCFVFLYLVFAGPGPWSVDAARKAA